MIDVIRNYKPQSDFEETDKQIMIELYETYQDALFKRFKLFHFSASGLVFNKDYTKVLMIYHKIYDAWTWMGGHMDGIKDFYQVSEKEIKEESGLKQIKPIFKDPVSIEILPVWQHYKNGEVIASHQHLNVTYAFSADEDAKLIKNNEETEGIKWVNIEDVEAVVTEALMKPIYKKIIERVLHEKAHNI